MTFINLSDQNRFEERSQHFLQSKYAKQLQKKYEDSPFEEEFKTLYYAALCISYFANILSALTASTWLFTYVLSVVHELPYPIFIATVFAGVVLIGLEAIQRFLATSFFKNNLQYGFHNTKGKLITLLGSMIIIATISILFSYWGGFDLVSTVTTPPSKQEPLIKDIEGIKKEYHLLIQQTEKSANDYIEKRKWRGRISTADAQKYQSYLDKKIGYQDSLVVAVARAEAENKARMDKAEKQHRDEVAAYNKLNQQKGTGLGTASIAFIALLYLSIWFMEFYDYKTASQYCLVERQTEEENGQGNEELNDDLHRSQKKYEDLLQQIQENLNKEDNQRGSNTTYTNQSDGSPDTNKDIEPDIQLPIGFYNQDERKYQTEKLFKQQIEVFKQNLRSQKVIYQDKHTIAHKDFKTGKIKHLDFGSVNNRINIYLGKIQKTYKSGESKLIPNQIDRLKYWINRRKELIYKMRSNE